MHAECFRVKVPACSGIAGFTAGGKRVSVLPGEYFVHRVKPKVAIGGITEALRFLKDFLMRRTGDHSTFYSRHG